MEVKFTVKNMSEQFYDGSNTIEAFNLLSDFGKYEKLKSLSVDLPKNIKRQDEQFNRRLELNCLIKSGNFIVRHDVSPRRGYEVHTFTFTKGK